LDNHYDYWRVLTDPVTWTKTGFSDTCCERLAGITKVKTDYLIPGRRLTARKFDRTKVVGAMYWAFDSDAFGSLVELRA
jgi:hypothetical protein